MKKPKLKEMDRNHRFRKEEREAAKVQSMETPKPLEEKTESSGDEKFDDAIDKVLGINRKKK